MKKFSLILTSIFLAVIALNSSASPVAAGEGQYLLRNMVGGQTRCLAYAVEVEQEYHVVVNCRGLVYPAQPPEYDRYILWADGGAVRNDPLKVADLLRGQAVAELETEFNRLFVTIENGSPRRPSGPMVMQGFAQPYDFQLVEEPTTPQITLTPTSSPDDQNATPTPQEEGRKTFWQTTFGKIVIIITAGFLIFVFIVLVYSRRI